MLGSSTSQRSRYTEGMRYVIGIDEVGRGAIAGPVAVGVSVLDPGCAEFPAGLRDSKLLAEPRYTLNGGEAAA